MTEEFIEIWTSSTFGVYLRVLWVVRNGVCDFVRAPLY